MSTMTEPTEAAWATRPGWGIAVDLLPREVLRGRRAKVHRRLVALGLGVVLLACGGLALVSAADRSSAQSSYDDAQAQTTDLTRQVTTYADITVGTTVVSESSAQAATLMAGDVDVVNLIARIRSSLPSTVTISNLAVQQAGPEAAARTTAGGNTVIGSVTIAGGGAAIKDLAPFVANLNHLQGVVDVVPGSTTQAETGMNYSLTLNFTDALYTHRYDQGAAE